MDVQVSRRPTEPILLAAKRSTLRSTSSTNDLTDDAKIHATELTCCPPCPPEERKAKVRLPRLVLRDPKKRDTEARSCIEINPRSAPDDALIHKTELPCCPPCDPPGIMSSKYTERKNINRTMGHLANEYKAEPSDLACFLAGCPPDRGGCKKHHRQPFLSHLSSKDKERLRDDFKAVEHDIVDEVSKLGLTIKGIKVRSPLVIPGINDTSEGYCDRAHIPDDGLGPEDKRTVESAKKPQLDGLRSSPLQSLRSSATSVDVFPHAMQSLEAAANDTPSQCLTTTVYTNFKFPASRTPEAPRNEQSVKKPSMPPSAEQESNPTDQSPSGAAINKSIEISAADSSQNYPSNAAIRPRPSSASMKSKPKSPSLLSGASKTSAYRHALLKPSVSEAQTIDMGLPVPPLLTHVTEISGNPAGEETHQSLTKKPARSALSNSTESEALPSPVISHLTNLQKAKDLVDSVKDRINATREGRKSKPRTTVESSTDQQSVVRTETRTPASNALSRSLGEEKAPNDPMKSIPDSLSSTPAVDSLNATYWGFVPAVKEAVQDAVHVAVRNAVHEVVVPLGTEQDEASEAYRKLVADSLAQAAKNADQYLRRASLWNEPPTSRRPSEVDTSLLAADFDMELKNPDLVSKHQENSDRRGDPCAENSTKKSPNAAQNSVSHSLALCPRPPSPGKMESVPLESGDERLLENQKHGWKISSPFKKGSPEYSVIPTRQSSRNRVLSPKGKTINSPTRLSTKVSQSRKRSYEKPATRASREIRSVSSLGSLRSFGSASKMAKRSDNGGFAFNRPSQENLGRKNTVHWLRDLLSNNEPYQPRLTALPPRTRRDQNSSTGRVRSQTAPAKPVTELFLGATADPANQNCGDPTSKAFDLLGEKKAISTETFAKAISDLENLLSEALFIARQAADREGTRNIPDLLTDAAAILKGGRKVLDGRRSRGRRGNNSTTLRTTDDISSVASIHESLRSFSESSASDRSEDASSYHHRRQDMYRKIPNRLKRGGTVSSKNEQANNQAGWPPAGRAPTPYPSGSISPSPRTPATPIGEGKNGLDKAGQLKPVGSKAKLTEAILSGNNATGSTAFSSAGCENSGSDSELVTTEFRNIDPFTKPAVENAFGSTRISQGNLSPPTGNRGVHDPVAGRKTQQEASNFINDRTSVHNARDSCRPLPMPAVTPSGASPKQANDMQLDIAAQLIKSRIPTDSVPSKREVRQYIQAFHHPPIQPRISSLALRKQAEQEQEASRVATSRHTYAWQDIDRDEIEPCSQQETGGATPARELPKPGHSQDRSHYSHSLDGSFPPDSEEIHWETGYGVRHHGEGGDNNDAGGHEAVELRDNPDPNLPELSRNRRSGRRTRHLFSLNGRNHVSLREHKGFSLARSHKRQSIARDWSPARKRFVASVACISTALVGLMVGIYAGEVPAIQYLIVDFHHYTILGNVFFFIGLSVPTFFFWPLPLLHGRKPYILGAMSIAMPLLFPQALSVGEFRSPYISVWRVALLLPRALMGFCLGFANMNFKSMLTDLFGASLQSANPHQEVVDEYDVRRHGGGMGVWLGIWTWCCVGSIGVGFLIGAIIINHLNPAWGFYASICIIALVLLLNVLCPEVRRSAFRRSVAEVNNGDQVSRRLARGEVKMHLVQTGPKWWGEEFQYGVMLSMSMLRQTGFLVMALYVAWIYGQMVLIIVVSDNL